MLGLALLAGRLARRGGGLVHGTAGAAGLALLALAWQRGRIGGPLALDAVTLLALGLAAGLSIAAARLARRTVPGAVLVLHAAIAGIGWLLAAGLVLG